jgi:hypothetical protein
LSSTARYRIHPAIGVARVGNADPADYFLGPELPNQKPRSAPDAGTSVPPFKSNGLIKRQAARFRIWEYVENAGVWSASREVSLEDDDVAELAWTVHLANRKASFFEFSGLTGSPGDKPNTVRRNKGAEPRTLEIDPLPRSIGGRSADPVDLSKGTSTTPSQERWPDPQPVRPITSLGQLRTDDAGRLIVIPGEGVASGRPKAKIHHYANNDNWFDDVGDGPITATLKLRAADGTITEQKAQGAWLLVGPPDFAPPIPQVVSLYDVLFDLAGRKLSIRTDESVYQTGELARLSGLAAFFRPGATPTYTVDFDTDVAPILRAAFGVTSVFDPSHAGTVMDGSRGDAWPQLSDPKSKIKGTRARIFSKLRDPLGSGSDTTPLETDGFMPRLFGDGYDRPASGRHALTVTPTQYKILERWAASDFIGSRLGPSSVLNPPEAQTVTPHGLDRAAIECASGGGFFPGIEVSWLIREPSLFAEPFRVKHGAKSPYLGDAEADTTVGAGFFSRQMALPWLADFRLCKAEIPEGSTKPDDWWGWWPSQRPDSWLGTQGERVFWHRASAPDGTPTTWREGGDMPSIEEMLDNWWKLGFIQAIDDGHYAETERADHVP